jgi:hypothetical protein
MESLLFEPALPLAAGRTGAAVDVFGRGGTQFLPVSGTLTDRLLVTYRAPAAQLAALVPAPFELDTHRGFGFLSVCAVEIADMGLVGTPRFLRWHNREFLYRLSVRLHGAPTFLTLRSEVSSRVLAFLGRHFSHYRPHLGRVELVRDSNRLCFETRDTAAEAEARVEVDLAAVPRDISLFSDEREAAQRLLGMTFSADVVSGRVRIQPIEHGAWAPRFVDTCAARFAFIDALGRRLATHFELDGTLWVHDVPHVWKAARWT